MLEPLGVVVMATQYCGDEYDHGQRHDGIAMCTNRLEIRCVVLNVRGWCCEAHAGEYCPVIFQVSGITSKLSRGTVGKFGNGLVAAVELHVDAASLASRVDLHVASAGHRDL
jgi:hypothetical protein